MNRFITFEGLDGAGKSTLIQKLKAELEKHQQRVTVTREPGGTALGEELRQILLRQGVEAPTARTELLLYEAIRAQHVELLIRPQLAIGNWVLCDRFTASSLAFQAGGRQIAETDVQWLNAFATQNLHPHLTVLLDLSYEEAQQRQKNRFLTQSEMPDRMESEAQDFHERVRASFLKQAQASATVFDNSLKNHSSPQSTSSSSTMTSTSSWLVLSAMQSPENLLETLLKSMKERGIWAF